MSSLDIEWIAMQSGLKPAIRLTVDPSYATSLETRVRGAGYAFRASPTPVAFPGRHAALIYYVAHDALVTDELFEMEALILPGGARRQSPSESLAAHRRIGELLGFPTCCISSFLRRLQGGITRRADGREAHEDFVSAEAALRASSELLGRLNDLSPDRRARLITFYPCRYDCPEAATYAAKLFNAARQTDSAAAQALRSALLGTMTINEQGQRSPTTESAGEVLSLTFAGF